MENLGEVAGLLNEQDYEGALQAANSDSGITLVLRDAVIANEDAYAKLAYAKLSPQGKSIYAMNEINKSRNKADLKLYKKVLLITGAKASWNQVDDLMVISQNLISADRGGLLPDTFDLLRTITTELSEKNNPDNN